MTQTLKQLLDEKIDFSVSESNQDEEGHKVGFSWEFKEVADDGL